MSLMRRSGETRYTEVLLRWSCVSAPSDLLAASDLFALRFLERSRKTTIRPVGIPTPHQGYGGTFESDVWPRESAPAVVSYRSKLCSSARTEQTLPPQPRRQTPRYLHIVTIPID